MQSQANIHPTEDELENCLLNRISEQGRQWVEEHLLICDSCRDTLQDIHATILARNQALEQMDREESARSRRWVPFAMPTRAWAGCAAAVLALLSWTYVAKTGAPVAESQVSLTATRSGNPHASAYALAGTRPVLNLDTTSLPSTGRYRIEVVDLAGGAVWTGEVAAQTPGLTVRLNKPIAAGRYWVRLNDAGGTPLREFELPVR